MEGNRIIVGHPAEAYYVRQLDVASNSGLAIIDEKSPAHYYHWVTQPQDEEDTEALAFGKAFHMAALEPDRFGDCYAVLPDEAPRDLRYLRNAAKPSAATLAAIDWWDTWEAANGDRIMLTSGAYAQALAMGESLRALRMTFGDTTITAGELFDACEKEVSAYWIDEDTGIQCKLRADVYEPDLGFAGDLKSALDASREAFARAAFRHRYHVQHATYCEGFRACGAPLKTFAFFPVEKPRPHVAASWHIDAMAESRGWELRQRSMRKLKACLDSGEWPGYTTTVQQIALPAFAFFDNAE